MLAYAVVRVLVQMRKYEKRKETIINSYIYDSGFEKMDNGELVDLEAEFSKFVKHKKTKPIRYLAWKYLLYWIASKYAPYDYGYDSSRRTCEYAAILFWKETMAYSKLVAADEVINRSTKYMLDEHKSLYEKKPIWEFKELFDLADLIVDSTYPENY